MSKNAAPAAGWATISKRLPRSWMQGRAYIRKYVWLYLMLLPVIGYYLVFHYYPMYGLVIAFKDFRLTKGIHGSDWVGFQWFTVMFRDPRFFRILFNTLKFSLSSLLFGFPAPIIFALFLNEIVRSRYRRFIQTVTYLPHFFSWAVCGGLVISVLSLSGPVNGFLRLVGAEPRYFLAEAASFLPIYVGSNIWKNFGWGSIIYLAAISSIDPQLYEAAIMDGAGRFRQMIGITIPSVKHIVVITFILSVGNILDVGFTQIYILSSDIIRSSTDVFSTYIYRVGIRGGAYSYTTAIGLWQSLVAGILILLTNKLAHWLGEEGIW